jgi:hypothetical protein
MRVRLVLISGGDSIRGLDNVCDDDAAHARTQSGPTRVRRRAQPTYLADCVQGMHGLTALTAKLPLDEYDQPLD